MPTRRSLITAVGAFAGAILPLGRAFAHHGFGGRYDIARPLYLEGIIRATSFRPPHPAVTLAVSASLVRPPANLEAGEFASELVVRDEDRGRQIEVEFPPVRLFFDLAGRLAIDDTVAVIALRNCLAPHQVRGQWIRLASGEVVVRSGRMQTEVRGCSSS